MWLLLSFFFGLNTPNRTQTLDPYHPHCPLFPFRLLFKSKYSELCTILDRLSITLIENLLIWSTEPSKSGLCPSHQPQLWPWLFQSSLIPGMYHVPFLLGALTHAIPIPMSPTLPFAGKLTHISFRSGPIGSSEEPFLTSSLHVVIPCIGSCLAQSKCSINTCKMNEWHIMELFLSTIWTLFYYLLASPCHPTPGIHITLI